MAQDCDAIILNETLSKCVGCRILVVDSHEYQMEAFMYTCVILLMYLFLTTIFMVKIISPKVEKSDDDDQRKFIDSQALKKFRDQEKKDNKKFEILSRKEVKKQMISYLRNMNVNMTDSGIGGEGQEEGTVPMSIAITPAMEDSFNTISRRFSEVETQTELNTEINFTDEVIGKDSEQDDAKSERSSDEFFV